MIVSINIISSSSDSGPKLPTGFAKISHDEVVIIELQGTLEVECNHIGERDGKFIGKLKIDATNKPTLLIGHHLLEGKITNLSKPLAVLVRSSTVSRGTTVVNGTAAAQDGEDVDMDTTDVDEKSDTDEVEWDMVAVVKRKIVFGKRPMPIVNLDRSKA